MTDAQLEHEILDSDDESVHDTGNFQQIKIGASVLRPVDSPQTNGTSNINWFCPIFLPYGRFIFCWDLFLFVILLYSCVEIPFSIAFQVSLSPTDPFAIIGFFIDIFLLLDIFINFRTSYVDKFDRLRIIYDPKLIAERYLKSWFIIDFLASTPFSYIFIAMHYPEETALFTSFRFLRILKLLRIVKILKMFHVFRENTMNVPANRGTRTLLKLIGVTALMLLTAHYFACLWYAIGLAAYQQDERSWIDIIVQNGDQDKGHFVKYSYAFYWAIVTLFTTGYGDIHAFNIYEQWTASIGILIGSCFFAYFIGVLTTGLSDDLRHQSKQQRVEQSLAFCAHYDLPKEIRRAVLTHIRYYNSYNYLFDYQNTIHSLPNHLQKEIEHYLARNVLKELDLFESLPPSIIGQIALRLKAKSVGTNQYLYQYGDIGQEIFIQRTGVSRLIKHHHIPTKYRDLKRGDVVGEDAILSRQRMDTVQCLMWSEFYVLNVKDILAVLNDHYDVKQAGNEWNNMKNIIQNTTYDSNVAVISTSSIPENNANDAQACKHRHVRFSKANDIERYVDPRICDEGSNGRESVVKKKTNMRYKRTFSEYEIELQKEESEVHHLKAKKGNKTFKAIKNMFLDRQRSYSRNEKVKEHFYKHKAKPSITYSAVSPFAPYQDDIFEDYHDFNADEKLRHNIEPIEVEAKHESLNGVLKSISPDINIEESDEINESRTDINKLIKKRKTEHADAVHIKTIQMDNSTDINETKNKTDINTKLKIEIPPYKKD